MESLAKLGIASNGTNLTNDTKLMDTLLSAAGISSSPLFLIYRQVARHLGFDPTLVFTLIGLAYGAQYVLGQVCQQLKRFVENYLMCYISIDQDDRIYDQVMKWLSQQPSLNNNRYLTAETVYKSAWDGQDEDENREMAEAAAQGGTYLNFANQYSRSVSLPSLCCSSVAEADYHRLRYLDTFQPQVPRTFGTAATTSCSRGARILSSQAAGVP